MTNYIENLKKELDKRALSTLEKNDIINDHKEMIEEAIADGLSEQDLESKFGSPKQVAEALADERVVETPLKKTFCFSTSSSVIDVNVHLVNEDVEISISNDDDIHVHFETEKYMDKYDVIFANDHLVVKHKEKTTFFEDETNQLITISLPKELKIKACDYHNVNGDTTMEHMHMDYVKCSVVNGDIAMKHMIVSTLKLNTVGSDATLEHMTIDAMDLSQVSGDLDMVHTHIKHSFNMGTVSGDVDLNDVTCDDVNVNTVSGDVDGHEFYPNTLKFRSISGDVTIHNKQKSDIKIVKQSSVSGDINISQ